MKNLILNKRKRLFEEENLPMATFFCLTSSPTVVSFAVFRQMIGKERNSFSCERTPIIWCCKKEISLSLTEFSSWSVNVKARINSNSSG